MSDNEHVTAIREVDNLTVHVDPGTLVRTPDGRVWIRQEPEFGGWEIVPPAVVDSLAEAEARAAAQAERANRLAPELIREVNRNRRLQTRIPYTWEQITEYCRLHLGDLAPADPEGQE